MACGKAHVGVQRGSKAPQQGDSGLGAALLDALNLIGSHFRAQGEIGDAQAEGDPPVIQGFAEGQGLADRDPLRIVDLYLGVGRRFEVAEPLGSRLDPLPELATR